MTSESHKKLETLLHRAEQCEVMKLQNIYDLYEMQELQWDNIGHRPTYLQKTISLRKKKDLLRKDDLLKKHDLLRKHDLRKKNDVHDPNALHESNKSHGLVQQKFIQGYNKDGVKNNHIPVTTLTGIEYASYLEAEEIGRKEKHIEKYLEDTKDFTKELRGIEKVIAKAVKYLLTTSNGLGDIDNVITEARKDLPTWPNALDFLDKVVAKALEHLRTRPTGLIDIDTVMKEVRKDLLTTPEGLDKSDNIDEVTAKALKDLLTTQIGLDRIAKLSAKVLGTLLTGKVGLAWLYYSIEFLISGYYVCSDNASRLPPTEGSVPFLKADENTFQIRRIDIFNAQLTLLYACSVRT